ncbi:MAG: hypothetical protein K2X47_05960, partial [Bdellovibrionales bacterium]|nr:hypothetical protein [Bdellovibrionales bacterium]
EGYQNHDLDFVLTDILAGMLKSMEKKYELSLSRIKKVEDERGGPRLATARRARAQNYLNIIESCQPLVASSRPNSYEKFKSRLRKDIAENASSEAKSAAGPKNGL